MTEFSFAMIYVVSYLQRIIFHRYCNYFLHKEMLFDFLSNLVLVLPTVCVCVYFYVCACAL